MRQSTATIYSLFCLAWRSAVRWWRPSVELRE
jgi:hypothetical protein